jgi:hypothetical protein
MIEINTRQLKIISESAEYDGIKNKQIGRFKSKIKDFLLNQLKL